VIAAFRRAAQGNRDGLDESLSDLLDWLWTAIAGPVLQALQITEQLTLTAPGAPHGRRLWWSPTGALAMLPLHAARLRGAENVSVLDRVISSYTSTLAALPRTRQ